MRKTKTRRRGVGFFIGRGVSLLLVLFAENTPAAGVYAHYDGKVLHFHASDGFGAEVGIRGGLHALDGFCVERARAASAPPIAQR